jgi:trans-aconitate methyltransferase
MPYADLAPHFRNSNLFERCYARMRYATAPLERVAALVPAEVTSLVEVGCSAGVFANVVKRRRPEVEILGVDVDPRKIGSAEKTVGGRRGLKFVCEEAFAYVDDPGPGEALAAVDCLYLWPPARQERFIRLVAARLPPGGYLLLKEMDDRPAWKRRWCLWQERAVVHLLGLTAGEGVYLQPGRFYRAAMENAGLEVETFDLSRGYPHPHFALRGRKGTS